MVSHPSRGWWSNHHLLCGKHDNFICCPFALIYSQWSRSKATKNKILLNLYCIQGHLKKNYFEKIVKNGFDWGYMSQENHRSKIKTNCHRKIMVMLLAYINFDNHFPSDYNVGFWSSVPTQNDLLMYSPEPGAYSTLISYHFELNLCNVFYPRPIIFLVHLIIPNYTFLCVNMRWWSNSTENRTCENCVFKDVLSENHM